MKQFVVFAIIAAAILTFLAKHYTFFSFDLYITRLVQQIDWPVFESLLLFMSWLGNYYQTAYSLFIFSAALFISGFRSESLILTLSTLGAVGISETLKLIVLRPRPDPLLIHQIENFYRQDSFPSGHVLFFMGFYGFILFLAFVKIRKRNLRNFLVGILSGMLVLIGLSRIYLGSHWFSDVLASYLIGSIWLYFVILIYGKIRVK